MMKWRRRTSYLGRFRGVGAYWKPQNRAKNRRKPQNRNKFRLNLKTELKALTDKALVGFRISLSFNFSTPSKLGLLANVLPRPSLVQNSLEFKNLLIIFVNWLNGPIADGKLELNCPIKCL